MFKVYLNKFFFNLWVVLKLVVLSSLVVSLLLSGFSLLNLMDLGSGDFLTLKLFVLSDSTVLKMNKFGGFVFTVGLCTLVSYACQKLYSDSLKSVVFCGLLTTFLLVGLVGLFNNWLIFLFALLSALSFSVYMVEHFESLFYSLLKETKMNMFNPMYLLSMTILFSGVVIVLSCDSKIGAWLGMEINVFGFLGVLSVRSSMSVSVSLKYFIVQALGSSLFFMGVLLGFHGGCVAYDWLFLVSSSSVVGGLFCKSGIFPLHGWVPSVVSSGDWLSSWFVMGVQKLAPFLVLISWCNFYWLMISIIGLSVVGSLGGVNQLSVRGILVYSSFVHSAWMLGALISSQGLFVLYFLGYLTQLSVIVMISYFLSMNKMMSNWLCILGGVMSLSLAGVPPMGGFLMKLIVFLFIPSIEILVFPIMGSVVALVFYLRLMSGFMLGYSFSLKSCFSKAMRVFIFFNAMMYILVGVGCVLI